MADATGFDVVGNVNDPGTGVFRFSQTELAALSQELGNVTLRVVQISKVHRLASAGAHARWKSTSLDFMKAEMAFAGSSLAGLSGDRLAVFHRGPLLVWLHRRSAVRVVVSLVEVKCPVVRTGLPGRLKNRLALHFPKIQGNHSVQAYRHGIGDYLIGRFHTGRTLTLKAIGGHENPANLWEIPPFHFPNGPIGDARGRLFSAMQATSHA